MRVEDVSKFGDILYSPEISGEGLVFPQWGNISISTLLTFQERTIETLAERGVIHQPQFEDGEKGVVSRNDTLDDEERV